MQPMLYIPGGNSTPRSNSDLVRLGAGGLLDPSVSASFKDLDRGGPDGTSGVLVTFDHPTFGHQGGYDAESQDWQPVVPDGELEAGRYWIGLQRGFASGPDDLIRSEACDGRYVKMLDGIEWLIPVAKFVNHRHTRTPKGELTRIPQREHLEFCQQAWGYYQRLSEFGTEDDAGIMEFIVNDPSRFAYCSQAIGKNYRTTPDLIDRLGLIGDSQIVMIAMATTSMLDIEEIAEQKKTAERVYCLPT